MSNGAPDARSPLHYYFEYLDREMSIFGILSAFCVAAVGGALTVLASLSDKHGAWLKLFWGSEGRFVILALILILFASFLFYRQRSELAYCYGQLALTLQSVYVVKKTTQEVVRKSDSWPVWSNYKYGLCSLFAASVELLWVVLDSLCIAILPPTIELWAPVCIAFLIGLVIHNAYRSFPDADNPFAEEFAKAKETFRRRTPGSK